LTPSTRLGTAAMIRRAFVEAQNYLDKFANTEPGKPTPARDLTHEAIGWVLRGEIPWRQHSHRADDIATGSPTSSATGW